MSGERGRTRISADATGPARRYARQTILPDFGAESVDRLGSAHAAVVGAGALGSMSSQLLARAGVGTITLIDRDVVDWTNLQRQVLYTEADAEAGVAKATAAAAALRAINSSIAVRAFASEAEYGSIERLLELGESSHGVEGTESEPERGDDSIPAIESAGGGDVIVDGTDSFETRLLINDVAVKHGIPYLYAGVVGVSGVAAVIVPGRTPCLRCLLGGAPEPGTVETCDTAGVLGPAASLFASLQAARAIRMLVEPDIFDSSLLEQDAWTGETRRVELRKARDPECPCCVRGEYEFLRGEGGAGVTTLCGRNAVQIEPPTPVPVGIEALAERLRGHGPFEVRDGAVHGRLDAERGDDGEPMSLTVFEGGRAIVTGSTDPARARGVYARYVGH